MTRGAKHRRTHPSQQSGGDKSQTLTGSNHQPGSQAVGKPDKEILSGSAKEISEKPSEPHIAS